MEKSKNKNSNNDLLSILSQAKDVIEAYQRTVSASKLESIERLAALVREERKKQKITQDLLAKLSGVSIGTVLAIEAGKHSVSLSNVEKVLQALGRTLWIK